ncbi:MAG: rhamnulokinase, partial [Promethearchaeota archaeon]
MSRYLAIDLGAESGRLVLGHLDGEKLSIKETYRFKTGGTEILGRTYWNIFRFYDEILRGLKLNGNVFKKGDGLGGIGVDTWGVDFVLLDENDQLINMPYHYRDKKMNDAFPDFLTMMPRDELYSKTGIQFLSFNSAVQLYALLKEKSTSIMHGKHFLMLPDYFNFILTGTKTIEYTDASTTQLLDACLKDWSYSIIEKLNIPRFLFNKPSMPGIEIGKVTPHIQEKFPFLEKVPVHLVGSHDTASAVMGCPLMSSNSAYLSSGTWSLLGMELNEPILTKEAREKNFTNEGGVGNKIRFLK